MNVEKVVHTLINDAEEFRPLTNAHYMEKSPQSLNHISKMLNRIVSESLHHRSSCKYLSQSIEGKKEERIQKYGDDAKMPKTSKNSSKCSLI